MAENKESYLRWLGRLLSKFPGGLKNVVVGIPRWLRKPYAEYTIGVYGMGGGIMGAIIDAIFPVSIRYLTNPQWGLITLAGFFLLTHGIYRTHKEAEYKVLFPKEAEVDHEEVKVVE